MMNAVQQFYLMNQRGLHFLNQACVELIPEKSNPVKISKYMPISLTHSFTKLISMILADTLGPEIHHLISANQTAFIKTRCIHENFIYVQQIIKDLHKKKIPSLFIKLDIFKAFDTVNWPYLLDMMTHLRFGQHWRNWISVLWCTISSSYMLNGEPSQRIMHCRGVRQGDPPCPQCSSYWLWSHSTNFSGRLKQTCF
jgi:hypothetical protein